MQPHGLHQRNINNCNVTTCNSGCPAAINEASLYYNKRHMAIMSNNYSIKILKQILRCDWLIFNRTSCPLAIHK